MNDKQLEFLARIIAITSRVYDVDRLKYYIISTYKELEEE